MTAQFGLNDVFAGVGPLKLLDQATSSGTVGQCDIRATLPGWALQVITNSTMTVVQLFGSLSTQPGTHKQLILEFDSKKCESGEILSAIASPAKSVICIMDSGALSSDPVDAWVSGLM